MKPPAFLPPCVKRLPAMPDGPALVYHLGEGAYLRYDPALGGWWRDLRPVRLWPEYRYLRRLRVLRGGGRR